MLNVNLKVDSINNWNELKTEIINCGQFKDIRRKYPVKGVDDSSYLKYFNFKKHFDSNIKRARRFSCYKQPPAEILDIGCGFGYFLFVCKKLGYEVTGMDRFVKDDPETECYSDMVNMFGLKRIIHQIVKYEKLPLPKKFDLITAFRVCFNNHDSSERWEKEEWQFLLADLKTHLKPGGEIYLQFNSRRDGNRRDFYSDSLKKYFLTSGAEVNGSVVIFHV